MGKCKNCVHYEEYDDGHACSSGKVQCLDDAGSTPDMVRVSGFFDPGPEFGCIHFSRKEPEIVFKKLSELKAPQGHWHTGLVDRLEHEIGMEGMHTPILIDENCKILDGYHRYLAAKRLKLNVVPTVERPSDV